MSLDCLSSLDQPDTGALATDWSAITPGSTAHSTNVHFVIRTRLENYQEVRLLGDAPQLGGNDEVQALSLARESSTAAVWSCTVSLTTGVPVNYKYMIMTRGKAEDEPNKAIRTLNPKGIDMWVDDEWIGKDQSLGDRRVRINRGIMRGARGGRGNSLDKAPPMLPEQMAGLEIMDEDLVQAEQLIICVFRLPVKCKRLEDGTLKVRRMPSATTSTLLTAFAFYLID